jgi:DNA-binding SARP family transcriptional activator
MRGRRPAALDFRVLGPLEVVAGGQALDLKPAKARALLGLLLLDPGRPVSAARLIDELWSGEPPASAGVSLRVLVSRLREAFATAGAPEAIATRAPGYALDVPTERVDARRFEALLARARAALAADEPHLAATTLRDALGLWRGPALADVSDPPMAAAEAVRLDELRLLALEERIEADLACGRHEAVLSELESLVLSHPLRERLWGARMLALYRGGRQAEALAAFAHFRGRLIEELGIEPGPPLRELQAAILAHDPSLRPPREAGSPHPTGVVTFLLTDIAGSSGLWERRPKLMAEALDRHNDIVARAVSDAGGVLIKAKGEGDSTFSAFARASDAVVAALELADALAAEPWPPGVELSVRAALHTGEAREEHGDYVGVAVNRTARLRSLARPRQTLLSQTTADLVRDDLPAGAQLVDLGRRPLRGHDRNEYVYELRKAPAPSSVGEEEFARSLPNELIPAADAVFVGREPELERLGALWRSALEGRHEVALVAGEPGIGKTRLVAEVARTAHSDGAVVLFGRCDEDLGVPYQPFAEALRTYVAACPAAELAAQAGRAAGDLARLVPEVGERLPGVEPATTGDPEDERYRLFAAVATLFAAASRARPLILVLDDLHWAAKPTLLMLRHLARARGPSRLLILGTYRDTELGRGHPLPELLADLRRDQKGERVRLKGLGADAVGAYVEASSGKPLGTGGVALAQALHESTEGNPFFLGELLRHLEESGGSTIDAADLGLPEGVKEVIARRLSRLSDEANRVLAVGSVVGATFTLPLLERISDTGADPERHLDALEEALRAGLIREPAPTRYAFAHALVRQTVYSELSSTRRARLHRRVAEAIEQAPDAEPQVGALAHHFAEAALDGQLDKAVHYALAAGRRSLERLAYEEAVTQLRRGLELLKLEPADEDVRRADLLLALAQARRELGDPDGNREAALLAANAARAARSPAHLARAALVYWAAAGFGITEPTVPSLCEEGLAALGATDPALRARLLARLTHYRAVAESQGFALADQVEEAVELARRSGDPEALAETLKAKIRILYGSWRVTERLSSADELVELGVQTDDHRSVLIGLAFRNDAYLELGDRAGYDANLAELSDRAARHETRLGRYLMALVGSMRALLEGRFDEAAALSERALANGGGRADPVSSHLGRLTLCHREQGRFDDALMNARGYDKRIRPHRAGLAFCAALQAEAGDATAAAAVLHELAGDDLAALPRDTVWAGALSHLAETCAGLEDAGHAEVLYEHLHPHRGHLLLLGGYLCLGAADRFLGMLAATLGRLNDAEPHYRRAIELEEAMRAAPLVARTRFWYARMLLARDAPEDREHATELLAATIAVASELGMASLLGEARALAA